MLSRSYMQRRTASGGRSAVDASVELLLKIDREYREKAGRGAGTIAPERFNPEGEAWLPILNGARDGWAFTALYSNTKLAHDLSARDGCHLLRAAGRRPEAAGDGRHGTQGHSRAARGAGAKGEAWPRRW